jgi:hypothetical protein
VSNLGFFESFFFFLVSNLGAKCWVNLGQQLTKVDHQRKGPTPPPTHPPTNPSPTPHPPLCIIIVVDVGSPHKINHFGMWKNGSHERDFGSFEATKRKEAKKKKKNLKF